MASSTDDDSPDTLVSFEHDGDQWEIRSDSLGRQYAVRVGHGRVSMDIAKRAKNNTAFSDHE